ncbi:MAG: response regulator transcription factor [Chitinophagaceae bacterium]|nr:MAG: response regulator transcription factor [Chitinophagaceae bacterium]
MSGVFTAVIIDDEPGARRLMRNLLQEHAAQVQVLDEAGTGADAIRVVAALKPDLIFLDIQMPDMTGFDVLEKLDHKPYVIFTTAFEEYAIRAFENLSVDYLLKPIREERLAQSMEKLKHFARTGDRLNMAVLQDLIRSMKVPAPAMALTVRTGDKISLVRFEEISFFEAQDKYVAIHTVDGQKYLSDQSLNRLVEILPGNFFRIQKSFIVNLDRIREMYRHLNGRFLFSMNDKTNNRLTSGRTYADAIKARFSL